MAGASTPVANDPWRWLAVNEERLLLHDGLVVMSDHIAVPSGVAEQVTYDTGLQVLDGKTPQELSAILLKECKSKTTSYAGLMEYRLNALKGLWKSLKEFEDNHATTIAKEINSTSKTGSGQTVSFASRVSLVLVFPLIKSLSRLDSTLSSDMATVLLETLRACEPLSLSSEPLDCINGLENLLCSWLQNAQESTADAPVNLCEVQNAASALVALAVAVGTGSLLLRTVHLLQMLKESHPELKLLVPGILHKLLQNHLSQDGPSGLSADSHTLCWGYNDGLQQMAKDSTGPRSIAFDGQFIYITSTSLHSLLKLGSGKRGTVKGLVYVSQEMESGWVLCVGGRLVHCKVADVNNQKKYTFSFLSKQTLVVSSELVVEGEMPTDVLQTFQFMSDGKDLFWLYVVQTQDTLTHPISGDKIKQNPVYLHTLHLQEGASPGFVLGSRVLLQKCDQDTEKNAGMLKALVRANPSYSASALSSLLGLKDKDDNSPLTSAGLSIHMLEKSVGYTTGSAVVLLCPPPNPGGGRGNMFGIQNSSKSLCLSVCYNSTTGKSLHQIDLQPVAQLRCALSSRGASMSTMAACYDSSNHCIWTCNDDWIDIWDCAGKVRIATHQLVSRLGKSSLEELIPSSISANSSSTLLVSEAISLMLRHIGIESCRLVPEFSTTIVHSLPLAFLKQCCDLLECSMKEQNWNNTQAIIITLQAVLPSFLSDRRLAKDKLLPLRDCVRKLVWHLLTDTSLDHTHPLMVETRRIVSRNCEALFLSHTDQGDLIGTLLDAVPGKDLTLCALREEMLVQMAHDLQHSSSLSTELATVSRLVRVGMMKDSIRIIHNSATASQDDLPQLIACSPVFPPTLQCGAMLLNVTLRQLVLCLHPKPEESGKEGSHAVLEEREGVEPEGASRTTSSSSSSTSVSTKDISKELEECRSTLLKIVGDLGLFEACEATLLELCKVPPSTVSGVGASPSSSEAFVSFPPSASSTSNESKSEVGMVSLSVSQLRVQALERSARGSVLGCLLPPFLATLSDPELCDLHMANTLQDKLSHLTNLAAKACSALYGEKADSSTIKIPAPWAAGRVVETIHPVRDNYRFKETVSFPGATNLYLKFDPRCSSQYDYDKVVVYAGESSSSPKVAEYGGNTHGFGSRSVLGKGWPKDLVRVDKDTVTLVFEMKSGREHSTPDKAMWGFACTVRPQETSESSPAGLPFLMDVYLSLASVCCSLAGQLYKGPPPSAEEETCKELLKSELLQCCVWPSQEESMETDVAEKKSPSQHISLPPQVVLRLRTFANRRRPTLRPSIQTVLMVDKLEDLVLSVCLKHQGTISAIQLLASQEQIEDKEKMAGWNDLLGQVFGRINSLERRLQHIAELESSWWNDVEDLGTGSLSTVTDCSFYGLLQREGSKKNLELLCRVRGVAMVHNDLLGTVRLLHEKMEADVEQWRQAKTKDLDRTPVTRGLVKGILDRANLLLKVTIVQPSATEVDTSLSKDDLMLKSVAPNLGRSLSLPPISTDVNVRRSRSGLKDKLSSLLELPFAVDKSNLFDQIFQFIGSKPEEAVDCASFLKAAEQHCVRGRYRVQALNYLHSLLTSDYSGLAIKQLLASVGVVLQFGPGVKDVACGGMAEGVREAFATVMHDVVELASKQPVLCIDTITLLSIIPYTRLEEQCLVRSGLVKLLDRLCSLVDDQKPLEELKGTEDEENLHRVTSIAWAAFQVLADHCVAWEAENSAVLSSGLAKQVSMLLTNHLSRAMDHLVVSEGSASEALQDALSLLLGLAKSHLGRTILSQPACISKLLLILTDQRPSPKLVLIALQLCRIALPLMTVADCSMVEIPSRQPQSSPASSPSSNKVTGKKLAAEIVNLLLAKLAEYIVPDASQVSHDELQEEYRSPEERDMSHSSHPSVHYHHDPTFDLENGMASVYLYKREGDSATEILQPFISQDPRHFRLGQRVHEVIQIDRALNEHGKAEVVTDTYRSCVRRALRWASMGFTVSVESPSETIGAESSGGVTDKKRAQAEGAAKKKNQELLKTDPPRPFLSGQVAYSLASEVIGLIHGLLTESGAAEVWGTAIKDAILHSLLSIPSLVPRLMAYTMEVHNCVATGTVYTLPDHLLNSACIANATFAVLGGFREALRPGMRVEVVGGAVEVCFGTIRSMSERKGIATIQMEDDPLCFGPDKTLEVPLSRIVPPKKDTMLPLKQLGVGLQLCTALCSVLNSIGPSLTHAHSSSDANTVALGLCRLFAELRTRACMCLAEHVQDLSMAELFLSQMPSEEHQPSPQKLLTQEAERCNCGLRLSLVASHCQSLRMLYRDCARPPPPRPSVATIKPKQMHLDVSRPWPPVVACSFTEQLTCVTFQGSSSTSVPAAQSGEEPPPARPKGVVIYANSNIPMQAPSFYWELEVSHLGGEGSTDLAMGYSPEPPVAQPEANQGQGWIYPKYTVLIRNNGRACQVNGNNILEWNKFRLRHSIKTSDFVGCGWIKTSAEGEPSVGKVYFTRNGERCSNEFTGVPGGLFPFLHIQKKSTRVKVNFGDRTFRYLEGHAHREAADLLEEVESSEAVAMLFAELPFNNEDMDTEEDRDRDKAACTDSEREEGVVIELSQTGPPTRRLKIPMPTIGYDSETSQGYHKVKSYESMLESGPLIRPGGGTQEEEEEEEGSGSAQEEDVHLLLVKAWEAKVFPVIQKRFRNEHERKSGLEQIKGALQLGMETIAQETVEFLYEENGGIPRDLHLPTMDDVKADLGKFTVSRVKKGSVVVVQKDLPYVRCGGRMMQKTQGLTGTVLDVDEHTETVQVECYLQNEGALVRFWYPVMSLERPPPGYRKASSLRGADAANMLVHRQLLKCESALVSMYCRQALLTVQEVIDQQEQDLTSRLLMASEKCFAEALLEGVTTTTNPDLAPAPSVPLGPLVLSPLPLFYSDIETVKREIQGILAGRMSVGVKVEKLAQRLCQTLLNGPQDFGVMELKVTETKEVIDVVHPDAAFILVSCQDDKAASSKPSTSSFKYPWARVMCYQGGQGKGGRQQLQEVARYPSLLTQPSASQQYCGPEYPALCLPCNRIHVKLGGCSNRPGKLLHIMSLSKEFPLALSFTHCLTELLARENASQTNLPSRSAAITQDRLRALLVCLESLSKFVCRIDCPIPLKELILHQLADVIWTVCSTPWPHPDWEESEVKLYAFPTKFLQGAQEELLKLYESEVAEFSKEKTSKPAFPPPESIGAGGMGRFSTYLQALLEFVLASFHYQHLFHGVNVSSSTESVSGPLVPPSSSSSSQGSLTTPTHGSATNLSFSTASPVPRSPGNIFPVDSPPSGRKSSRRLRHRKATKKDGSSEGVRKEGWLQVARKAGSLLRSVALWHGSASPLSLPKRKSSSAYKYHLPLYQLQPQQQQQQQQHPCNRLVVLCGISPELDGESVDTVIRRVCKLYGGLYKDEVFRTFDARVVPAPSKEGQQEDGEVSEVTGKEGHGLIRAAVLEVCCGSRASLVSSALLSCQTLQGVQDEGSGGTGHSLQALAVNNSFSCGEEASEDNRVLAAFLRARLAGPKEDHLSELATAALQDIFNSDLQEECSAGVALAQVKGTLGQFLSSVAECCDVTTEALKEEVWKKYASDEGQLTCGAFVKFVEDCVFAKGKESEAKRLNGVWLGFLDCGYDLHLQGYSVDYPECVHSDWTAAQDTDLVHYLDKLCQSLAVGASLLQPWDVCISEQDTISEELASLQDMSLRAIRHRFCQLKLINHQISMLLPVVDLRSSHPFSLGQLISSLSHLLFYDVKISFLHSVLNAATRRSLDQAPPEIKMDPLELVEGVVSEPHKTQFCQAAQQMLTVPSPRLCVALASGGDPTYAFNVRLSGEEVLGTSGSFRHFLWHVVRELQSSSLSLLLHCPSSSVGINQGKFILAPGPISYAEEKLLQFFGQLLGVSIRAGVPIALDFLPCFWKSLKGEPLTLVDLKEADYVTYKLTSDVLKCTSSEEFQEVLSFQGRGRVPLVDEEMDYSSTTGLTKKVVFTYVDLNGMTVELVPGGKEIEVEFYNRKGYAEAVRQKRLEELTCEPLMTAIKCGMASVIPLQLLSVLTCQDLALRVCGRPDVNLDYLRRHTMYQVGLMETDKHVQYFWTALESFSQDELRKFIKFACNQERIPFGLPCRDGQDSDMNVPPYPMKIAPPDGRGPPDSRFIRAETCMFMVKLPQYSSQQVMTERLRYAIHCREDPLSG